jgi:hypothetical protein
LRENIEAKLSVIVDGCLKDGYLANKVIHTGLLPGPGFGTIEAKVHVWTKDGGNLYFQVKFDLQDMGVHNGLRFFQSSNPRFDDGFKNDTIAKGLTGAMFFAPDDTPALSGAAPKQLQAGLGATQAIDPQKIGEYFISLSGLTDDVGHGVASFKLTSHSGEGWFVNLHIDMLDQDGKLVGKLDMDLVYQGIDRRDGWDDWHIHRIEARLEGNDYRSRSIERAIQEHYGDFGMPREANAPAAQQTLQHQAATSAFFAAQAKPTDGAGQTGNPLKSDWM